MCKPMDLGECVALVVTVHTADDEGTPVRHTGRSSLDQVLSQTETLNEAIKEILDVTSERWGVLVVLVELKDIELPDSMQRAMAREAEAEREKRGKIIAAEGEALSVGKLAEAADVILDHPIALQLRNLQVLAEIAIEKNSTIIFPAQFLDSVHALAQFVAGERNTAVMPGGAASVDAPASPAPPSNPSVDRPEDASSATRRPVRRARRCALVVPRMVRATAIP